MSKLALNQILLQRSNTTKAVKAIGIFAVFALVLTFLPGSITGLFDLPEKYVYYETSAATVTTAAQFQSAVTNNTTAITVNASITSSKAAAFSSSSTFTITVNSGYTLKVTSSDSTNTFTRTGSYTPNFVFQGAGTVYLQQKRTDVAENAVYTPDSLTIKGDVNFKATTGCTGSANCISAGKISISTTGSVYIGCTSSAMTLVGQGGLYCNNTATNGISVSGTAKVYVAGASYGLHTSSNGFGGISVGETAQVSATVTGNSGKAWDCYGAAKVSSGAKVTLNAKGATSYGFNVLNFNNLTISGTSVVNVTAGKYPVYCQSSVYISGSASVTAHATDGASSNAFYMQGDYISTTTGTVKATISSPSSNTIYCTGKISITNGTHYYGCSSATGAVAGSWALTATQTSEVSIVNATVYAKGTVCGIRSISGDVEIFNSTIVAEASNTSASYGI